MFLMVRLFKQKYKATTSIPIAAMVFMICMYISSINFETYTYQVLFWEI